MASEAGVSTGMVVFILAGSMGDCGEDLSMAGDQDIEDVAILIHRSLKIMVLATDREERLVHVPDVPETTLSPTAASLTMPPAV